MPEGGRILEIGSGNGASAAFLKDAGFGIIASDVADTFLDSCRDKGLTTVKLDAINDDLPTGLSGVLAWRTFVYFTKEDLGKTFSKIYASIDPGGVFVFNVFNKAESGVDEQWQDFSDEYEMGEKRFFAYYTEEDIRKLVERTGFKIDVFFKQGGKTGKKWLCYVVTR